MTFLKLFLVCTFKESNLAEKRTKLNSAEFMEFVFSKSAKLFQFFFPICEIEQWGSPFNSGRLAMTSMKILF